MNMQNGSGRLIAWSAAWPLSPREYQCLEWSARGKSAGEIGIILGIAERTAGFHLDSARAKLRVSSLRQAIVLLTESKSRKWIASPP
ncbi:MULTISPECIES: helix-turn-helix transcriptional regulator [unclassified Bradyrhizobium]|uniref:helix-turn-helix domain-containing protein n=1 Tax=unclassified Bradyrhizobium TaxID=2631580 RepID=UPI0023EF2B5D|nr:MULTISPECIES: helix-turn-helix transcriptional regulator [unclassified Bradyrhizobium]